MHWQLWDTESSILVGSYESKADALAVVRDALHRHGLPLVMALALGAEHDDEGGSDADLPPVTQGSDLIARALDALRTGDRATVAAPPSTRGVNPCGRQE
jgi:hypothetical protein